MRVSEWMTPDVRIAHPDETLREVARTRPRRALALEKVDGEHAPAWAHVRLLRDAGFKEEYRFMRLTVG